MLMTNFLKNRRSIREFRKRKIDQDTLIEIISLLGNLENKKTKDKVRFNFYENGEKIFEKLSGLGGYAGVMVESPHYIGLEELNHDRSTELYGAYYMEKLITDLNKLGLDTCWISVGDLSEELRKDIFENSKGEINYLLAIGYSKRKNPFVNEPFSERLGVEEIVYSEGLGKEIESKELKHRGLDDLFYYVRFAPSKGNCQPWRFLLDKDKVILLIKHEEGQKPNYTDAGIIMYYFEALGKAVGIMGEWELIDGILESEFGKYEYIGEIKL